MKIPCEDCICFPMCKQKERVKVLVDECELLDDTYSSASSMKDSTEITKKIVEIFGWELEDQYLLFIINGK